MENNNIATLYIDSLINAKLIDIGRCSNMIWLLFSSNNNTTYSLHIQCPCRFTESSSNLLSSGDIFLPSKAIEKSSEVSWDVQNGNLFDEKSKQLVSKAGFIVSAYSVNSSFDLTLLFQNGIQFTTFSNCSSVEEQWRLFSKGSGKEHLVANSFTFELA